jgi:hypothetical protein
VWQKQCPAPHRAPSPAEKALKLVDVGGYSSYSLSVPSKLEFEKDAVANLQTGETPSRVHHPDETTRFCNLLEHEMSPVGARWSEQVGVEKHRDRL